MHQSILLWLVRVKDTVDVFTSMVYFLLGDSV